MMGPLYENVTNADFRMYFESTLVYEHIPNGNGKMHLLHVDSSNPTALAHDTLHMLMPVDSFSDGIRVLGRDLFMSPHFLLHRWPMEYVPLGPNAFIRVCGEPVERRACKGTQWGALSVLPPVDAETEESLSTTQRRALKAAAKKALTQHTVAIACGAASVLATGHPRPMARLVRPEDAQRKSSRECLRLLSDDSRGVYVPDFTTCLVKVKTPSVKTPYALVLYRGTVLGTLRNKQGKLVFTGRHANAFANHPACDLYQRAAGEVVARLCGARVVWPKTKRTSI